jgi:5-methylcytosine-specific restriction protein A
VDQRTDEARAWRYLYDSAAWKSLRLWQLRREPLCRHCLEQDLVTEASIVDHITPHKGDVELFFDPLNLQSLCKLHHDAGKQSHERTGIERGCDEHGMPLDARHHWRSEGRGGKIFTASPLPAASANFREKNPKNFDQTGRNFEMSQSPRTDALLEQLATRKYTGAAGLADWVTPEAVSELIAHAKKLEAEHAAFEPVKPEQLAACRMRVAELHAACAEALAHFQREIWDDATMVDSDFGEAYRLCKTALAGSEPEMLDVIAKARAAVAAFKGHKDRISVDEILRSMEDLEASLPKAGE